MLVMVVWPNWLKTEIVESVVVIAGITMKKIIKLKQLFQKDSNLPFSPALLQPPFSGWDYYFNCEGGVSDDFMTDRKQPENQKRELF